MEFLMPHKHHQSNKHKFTKAKYKVTNWSEYTEGLRRCGNVTIWFSEDHHVVACELTDNSVGDSSAIEGLLNQVDDFDIFMGDGAYDGDPTYKKILDKNSQATVVIPPRKNAVEESSDYEQRNVHTAAIKNLGRMAWQKLMNYGIRAHSEFEMLRYKIIIGPKINARKLPQQKAEANISARVLNIMTQLGMPKSVKVG